MRGVKLTELVKQVKVLCADSIQEGSSIDNDIAVLLDLTQTTLAATNDWASLENKIDVSLAAGDRYANFPALNLARPVVAEYKWNELWSRLEYGIQEDQYNSWDEGEQADPMERWKLIPITDATAVQTFEVWPTPATTAQVRFTGQQALLPFKQGDDLCTVDSLLLVYFTAAERLGLLGRPATQVQAILGKANALAAALRSVEHRENNTFSWTKYSHDEREQRKVVRILSV